MAAGRSQKFKDRVGKSLFYKLGLAWDNDRPILWVQTRLIGYWNGKQEKPVGVNRDGWAKRLGGLFKT
jgi:hypothetical protein